MKMELSVFKVRIKEAMEWAKTAGVTLVTNMWGIRYDGDEWVCNQIGAKCTCPAGALLLKEQPKPLVSKSFHPSLSSSQQVLLDVVGLDEDNLRAFLAGIDGTGNWDGRSTATSAGLDWYQFGNEVRVGINGKQYDTD